MCVYLWWVLQVCMWGWEADWWYRWGGCVDVCDSIGCMCVCAHAKTMGIWLWRTAVGGKSFWHEREGGHLSSSEKGRGGDGVKGKRKEGWGWGVKPPSLLLFSAFTVNLMATDHSADPTSALLQLLCLTDLSPLSQGPRKLLFRSLVQQIHTDARRRRMQRDKGFLSTCFPC